MTTLKYRCRLLSDIIINVKSASEGENRTLDFIPGSNFMGIVAGKLYANNDPDTRLIVHSGEIAFGDAHPLLGRRRSLKIPLSLYYPKTKSIKELCLIHHCYNRNNDLEKNQLKQCREGFYTFDPSSMTMEKVQFDKAFSIKSAYDREQRRSKDSQMFGYESIPEGMEYCFCVQCPSERIAEKIDGIIQGRQHVGRSRSAQYGLVEIERYEYDDIPSTDMPEGTDSIVYAESRLAFFDDNGMPELQPEARQLGFDKGTIDWSKSQVRTFMYSPWNFKRQSFDFDRCGIEKGSVFYVKDAIRAGHSEYIGSFNNEGFGKVIYNPSFLTPEPGTNGEAAYSVATPDRTVREQTCDAVDSPLIRCLERQKKHNTMVNETYRIVNVFVEKYEKLFKGKAFASQWGHIRELANQFSDFDVLSSRIEEYLTHGIASEKWDEKGRLRVFREFLKSLDRGNAQYVIINLASEMAKKCR